MGEIEGGPPKQLLDEVEDEEEEDELGALCWA